MRPGITLALLTVALQASAQTEPAYAGQANCRILNPVPRDDERATWSGACVDGYASGPGLLQWYHHEQPVGGYDGTLQRGRPHGSGEYFYSNGNYYKGEFQNGRRHGAGVYRLSDGSSTRGQFADGDLLDGEVEQVSANGNRYTGTLRGGARDGRGVMQYALGGSYEGDWQDDQPQGAGTIIYPNGKRLAGTFEHGLRVGSASAAPKAEPQLELTAAYTTRTTADRERLAHGLSVPPQAAYEALTFAQQLLVKQPYQILQDADRPPYPLRGQRALLTILSTAQRYAMQDAVASFDILIDADGKPTGVRIVATPNPEFGRYFAAAALQVRFSPAVCGGAPCAMAYPVRARLSVADHAAD
ncbi:MAG: hypothetical protein ACEQSK_03635 [Sphingomonadaceae bacterium]